MSYERTLVSKRGLEPLRPFERQPLKLVRLPFRHSDVVLLLTNLQLIF